MTDRIETPPGEPSDEVLELASRYVDGDLTADERALAEADPEVMAWAARFGPVRAALHEPVAVDDAGREAALAAALTAFDELGPSEATRPVSITTAAGTVSSPRVDDLAAARARRNGRLAKWLGAAAAIVAVGVAGVTIAGNRDNGDSNLANFATPTTAAGAADTRAAAGSSEKSSADQQLDTATAAAPAPAEAAPEAPATSIAAADTTAASAATTEAAGDAGGAEATAAPAASTAPVNTASPITTTTVPLPPTTAAPVFETPDDLRAYAAATPPPAEPITTSPCVEIGVVMSVDATYQGTPAVIYVDEQNNTIVAYDASTCDVLVSTRRFEP
jgi:hypothetical protein